MVKKKTLDYIFADNGSKDERKVGKENGTANAQPWNEEGVAQRDAKGGRSMRTTSTTEVSVDDQQNLKSPSDTSSNSAKGVPSPTEKGPSEGNVTKSAASFSGQTHTPPVGEGGGVVSVEKGTPEGNAGADAANNKSSGEVSSKKSSTAPKTASKSDSDRLAVYKRQAENGGALGAPNDLPRQNGILGAVSRGETGTGKDDDLSNYITKGRGSGGSVSNPFKKDDASPGAVNDDIVRNRAVEEVLDGIERRDEKRRREAEAAEAAKKMFSEKGSGSGRKADAEDKDAELDEMEAKREKFRKAIENWDRDDEKKKKRYRSRQILNAIGDGLSAIANLYFTGRGAPNMSNPEKGSLLKKSRDWFEQQRKERLGERDKMLSRQERLDETVRRYRQNRDLLKQKQKEADDRNALTILKMNTDAEARKRREENDERRHKENMENRIAVAKIRKAAGSGGSRSGGSGGKDSGGSSYSSKRIYYRGNNRHRHSFDKRDLNEGNINELYNSPRVDRKVRKAFEDSINKNEETDNFRPTMEQKWEFIQKLLAQRGNYEFAKEVYDTLGAIDEDNPNSNAGDSYADHAAKGKSKSKKPGIYG